MKFSEKLKQIKPSGTLAITAAAKAMRSAGEDVIILAAGEPDFDTPDSVKKAAVDSIAQGFTKYTPVGGTKTLKEAICRKFQQENGLKYNVDEIVISNGAKHSLYNVLQVICNPGDEVLIIPPYWLSYPEMIKLAGAVPKVIPARKEDGFKVQPEDIRSAAVKGKTKALIINSPSNPAGVVYDKGELGKIGEVCVENGMILISDEIYEKIIFDGKKHFSAASISDDIYASTVVVNGVSKSFSMTGWRIGYMAANKEIARMVTTLQSHSTSNPCSISQAAAENALTADLDDEIKRNCEEFQRRRDVLIELLSAEKKLAPFKPIGAFYLFCDISGCGMGSMEFSQRLLDEKKVAVIPGAPFGEDSFIRISFAAGLDTIKEGVKRISDWVNGL